MLIPELTTERLLLRAPHLDDLPVYKEAWADERTTRYFAGGPRSADVSYGKFLQMTGMWALYGFGYWVWVSRDSGAFVGCGGLADHHRGIAELDGYPEAGWMIVPDAWGQGYTTEAMLAVMNWADGALKAPETRCIIDADHAASIRVAEKIGYRHLGNVESALGTSALFSRNRSGI
jgi:RimJ/RimL family protein N-acetyltransferase